MKEYKEKSLWETILYERKKTKERYYTLNDYILIIFKELSTKALFNPSLPISYLYKTYFKIDKYCFEYDFATYFEKDVIKYQTDISKTIYRELKHMRKLYLLEVAD